MKKTKKGQREEDGNRTYGVLKQNDRGGGDRINKEATLLKGTSLQRIWVYKQRINCESETHLLVCLFVSLFVGICVFLPFFVDL